MFRAVPRRGFGPANVTFPPMPGPGASSCSPAMPNAPGHRAASGFVPATRRAGLPLAMTAHMRYTGIDSAAAAVSPRLVAVIRDDPGFDGVLMSDDISRQAPGSGLAERGRAALAAKVPVAAQPQGAGR